MPRLKKKPSCADFLGKEALLTSLQQGLQRRLVCLTLDTAEEHHRPLYGMETLWRDGACVGYVRSTAFGHTVGSTIAYGYVTRKAAVAAAAPVGTETSSVTSEDMVTSSVMSANMVISSVVTSEKITNEWLQAGAWEIGDRGERCKATLHLKSPYDPSNEKIAAKHEPSSYGILH